MVFVWCGGVVLWCCGGVGVGGVGVVLVVVLVVCGAVLWCWAQGVAQLKSLHAVATLSLLADRSQYRVNQFGTLGVMLPALVYPKTK